jgi:hypothetical protein
LVEAIGFGDLERLEALRPTDAELQRGIGGAGSPLVITVLTGQPTVAEWILTRRPDQVSKGLGAPGYPLVDAAADWDAPEVAAVALAQGADRTIRDGSPARLAEHFGRERFEALLS